MTKDKYYFERIFSKKNFKFNQDYDKNILKSILSLKKKGKVLDLGCGEGGLAIALSKRGFKITVVDISKSALENLEKISKEKPPTGSFK